MTGNNVAEKYLKEQEEIKDRYKLLIKKRKQYGWLRFIVFILMVLATWKVFTIAGYFGFVPLVIGLAILLFLVSKDADNNDSIQNNLLLQKIVETELNV